MNYSTFSLANGAVPAPHLRNDHRQLEFALAYAERCWLVIPNHTPDPTSAGDAGECSCMPFDRCRKGYPGKHPRFLKDELEHGFKDATADPERICRWWSQWAVANIGIQPKLSCLAILDIDRRNGGDVSLGQLVATNGPLPPTPTVQRDSVGIVHYYFRHPAGLNLADSALAPGVELIINKQVIAPPSLHLDGARYEWLHDPDDVELANLPDWIISLSQRATSSKQNTGKASRELSREISLLLDSDSQPCSTEERSPNIRALFSNPDVALACMRCLGVPLGTSIGQPFHCILPDHVEEHPSAVVYPYTYGEGVHSYFDLHHEKHGGVKIYPLGAVLAFLAYGQIKHLSRPELTTWGLRLLCEAGVLTPVNVSGGWLPPDTSSHILKVFEGFVHLLRIRWLYEPDKPAPFSWRFAAAWCGVLERAAGEAIQWLIGRGYLRHAGKHAQAALFQLDVANDNHHLSGGIRMPEMKEPRTENIDITTIKDDFQIQQRTEGLNKMVVKEYQQLFGEGGALPPLTIFRDQDDTLWLADGFHRLEAMKGAGTLRTAARIYSGSKRDAILYACGANAEHGLQRTNADKRKAAMSLLQDEEWSKWSDSDIARRSKVHQTFVSKIRRLLNSELSETDGQKRTYQTKHGTTSTMDTADIGRRHEVSGVGSESGDPGPISSRETDETDSTQPKTTSDGDDCTYSDPTGTDDIPSTVNTEADYNAADDVSDDAVPKGVPTVASKPSLDDLLGLWKQVEPDTQNEFLLEIGAITPLQNPSRAKSERVVDTIQQAQKPIGTGAIAMLTGLERKQVSDVIQRLKKDGRIEEKHPGLYALSKRGKE